MNDFVAGQHGKIQPHSEVRYERNPILNPPSSSSASMQPPSSSVHVPQIVGQASGPSEGLPSHSFTMASRSGGSNFGAMGSAVPSQGGLPSVSPSGGNMGDANRLYSQSQNHGRSFSHGNMLSQPSALQQQQFPSRNSAYLAPRHGGDMMGPPGPPQLGVLSFQGSQPSPQSSNPPPGVTPQISGEQEFHNTGPLSGVDDANAAVRSGAEPTQLDDVVFGKSLKFLFERDGLAVPMVVYQCIQAVDLFGLGVEGIYRQSGSLNHVNKLREMFDKDSSDPALDFRNPENFYHDVNSVTGLLKQFFRGLPEPLLTYELHGAFVNAAKNEDDNVRRDSLHAIINSLPDPNYATLRAMTLHLYRVMDNSHVNRMSSHNLAVIFGPTLMGSDPSVAISDAGWQIKVVDTILQNTYRIFDED
ncbi:hypothetical protein E4U53_006961 [Claviceps sorghi]|nr:hypothetical protein E4U53_006961 [Claviceps sorghi]